MVPVLLALELYRLGYALARWAPGLGTSGPQMLVWGFFISTWCSSTPPAPSTPWTTCRGSRRYDTPDTSRNNPLLALLTLGEGWHNNHHHYAIAARQGFFWWEIDLTFYILQLMSALGIIMGAAAGPEQCPNAIAA